MGNPSEYPNEFRLVPSTIFARQMRKLEPQVSRQIRTYLDDKDLLDNPRSKGKILNGNMGGFWRYRIGDYRVICEIKNKELIILALKVGHRSTIYRSN
jgi:mRNA interferase RelE/StbE